MCAGIYRQRDWVALEEDDGHRSAMQRFDYDQAGISPPFDQLETDIDYHVHILEIGGSSPGTITATRSAHSA